MNLYVGEGYLNIDDEIVNIDIDKGYSDTFDIKIILPETRISFKAENKEKLQKIADKFNQVLEKE